MKTALGYAVSYALGALVFAAVMLFVWFGIGPLKPYLYPNNDLAWIKGLYEIKERRLRETSGPRIVLIGGSSVHFGFDAAAMSRSLQRDVVNFGVHGGLGAPYILDRAQRNLRSGDTAILILEYPLYRAPPNVHSVFFSSFEDKLFWLRMPVQDWPGYVAQMDIHLAFKAVWENVENRRFAPLGLIPGPYKLQNVDPFGVERGNLPQVQTEAMRKRAIGDAQDFSRFAPSRSVVAAIDGFVTWARVNRVTVVAGYPPMLDHANAQSAEAAKWFADMGAFWHARQVPLLSRPQDYFLSPDQVFDTAFHANDRGMELVTERLTQAFQGMEVD